MSNPKIKITNLHKAFGRKVVLDGIDLEIAEGESLVVILNLSSKDYAEKQWECEGRGVMCRVMVDFPSSSANVKWTDLFTTDNPEYDPEFDDLRQEIRLFRCRDHYYEWC